MTNYLHKNDLPINVKFGNEIAIDCEAMGLNNKRDRLCVIQLSDGDGDAHLVQFDGKDYSCKNLREILSNKKTLKIFHYARFDVGLIKQYIDIKLENIYCTKVASKLARTYTDRHSFKELNKELLGKDISKQQQSSDWGREEISEEQIKYAANDVLTLHELREILDGMLVRENRKDLAQKCFDFIPLITELDALGWDEHEIFRH